MLIAVSTVRLWCQLGARVTLPREATLDGQSPQQSEGRPSSDLSRCPYRHLADLLAVAVVEVAVAVAVAAAVAVAVVVAVVAAVDVAVDKTVHQLRELCKVDPSRQG